MDPEYLRKIEPLRKRIDKVDNEIMNQVSERIDIVKEVAALKKQYNIPILDQNREKELLNRLRGKARAKGLNEDFIGALYEAILDCSKRTQKNENLI